MKKSAGITLWSCSFYFLWTCFFSSLFLEVSAPQAQARSFVKTKTPTPKLPASPKRGVPAEIKSVVIVILENTGFDEAMKDPVLTTYTQKGALLANYYAVSHPSQPNYLALISGTTHGIRSDSKVDLNGQHLGDLLATRQLTWKTYAEGYPGNCFLGHKSADGYARKHNPWISFKNVQDGPLCQQIQSSDQFDLDVEKKALPAVSLYIPNMQNDGHDTSLEYATTWLQRRFGKFLEDPSFMSSTLLMVTFDEDRYDNENHIYAVLLGAGVKPGTVSQRRYNHYSTLATIEKIFALPNLGQEDAGAPVIQDVWNLL